MKSSIASLRGNIIGAVGAALIAGGAFHAAAQEAPTQISGSVKDGATQAAIVGAKVTLLSIPGFETTTDANGLFTLLLYDPTGINAGPGSLRQMQLRGTELSFSTLRNDRVRVTLHDLRGHCVATLKDAKLPAGDYTLSAAPVSVRAGLYVVRAVVGNQSRSFRMSTLGGARARFARAAASASAPASARLAKAAVGGVDILIVSKDGYLKNNHEVMAYAEAQAVVMKENKPATANLAIFTDDSTMGQIDWANAAIYSWEQTAVLLVDSAGNGVNNSLKSMQVSTMEFGSWNGWAFHVANLTNGQPTADLSPYAEGSLHLSVKGNAPSIGVMISSPNQPSGTAPLIDLAGKGYLPDTAWHEITIPMSEFAGTLDLSSVFVYCGFVSPSVQFSAFDATATYVVDDVYFMPKK